jgi:hypothetical protein
MERSERLRERDHEGHRLARAQGCAARQEKVQAGPERASGQDSEVRSVPLDDLVDRGEVLVVERTQHAQALDDLRALTGLCGHGHERQVVLAPGTVDDDPRRGVGALRVPGRPAAGDLPAPSRELCGERRREWRFVGPAPRPPGSPRA